MEFSIFPTHLYQDQEIIRINLAYQIFNLVFDQKLRILILLTLPLKHLGPVNTLFTEL